MKHRTHAPSVRSAPVAGRITLAATILSASAAWAYAPPPEAAARADTPGRTVAGDAGAPGAPILLAQAADEVMTVPPARRAAFTRDQTDRGERLYERACVECHGDDLRGGLNGGAPLRGLAFEQKYAEGAPAAVLFIYLSNQMPPNAPGRYSERDYADLMAFILKENGFRPGEALPSDIDALLDLVVEK
jgi:mono/diheme cytochrome c family protein